MICFVCQRTVSPWMPQPAVLPPRLSVNHKNVEVDIGPLCSHCAEEILDHKADVQQAIRATLKGTP